MKKLSLLTKTLLVAAGLLMGANAWAYDTPNGYKVGTVYVGHEVNNQVLAETFANTSSLSSAWSLSNTLDSNNKLEMSSVNPGFGKPAIGSVPTTLTEYTATPKAGGDAITAYSSDAKTYYSDRAGINALSSDDYSFESKGTTAYSVPTYVVGKCILAQPRGEGYAKYTLNTAVSSGKLVLNADLYASIIANHNQPIYIKFFSSSDEEVLTLNFANGSNNFQYSGSSVTTGNVGYNETRSTYRTYCGYSVRDVVLDLDEGTASVTLDCISDIKNSSKRTQATESSISFGTGKNIAYVQFYRSNVSKANQTFYIDNMSLYTLISGTASTSDMTFIGSKDYEDGYLGNTSGDYVIKPNGKLHLQFKNFGSGAYSWDNWIALFNNADKSSNLAYVRSDAWEVVSGSNTGISTSGNYWDDFQTDMYGSTVAMDITRTDGNVNMVATITTTASEELTLTFNKAIGTASEDIVFRLSEEGACLVLDNTKSIFVAPPAFAQTSITNTGNPIITVSDNILTGNIAATYYTTDGATPTESSIAYSTPVTVTGGNTIKAVTVATAADGTTTLTSNEGSLTTTEYVAGQTYDLSATDVATINAEGFTSKATADYGLGSTNRYSTTSALGNEGKTILGGLFISGGTSSGNPNTWYYWMSGQGLWQSAGSRNVTVTNTEDGEVALFTVYDCSYDGSAWSSSPYTEVENYESDCSYSLSKSNNSSQAGNHVYMLKKVQTFVPAGTTVSKTITSAGWATYCSPYALDFSSSIENLTKAYIVTGHSGSALTLSEITGTIPANTGILLEGEGAVSIPVVASSSTDVSANKLVGVTANTNIAANEGYVLMAEPSLGFYQNANEFTVGANTAYLPASFTSGARSAYFFRGDITGVDCVEAAAEAKAQDGKFIENGKLVIVKNGVKYNAAGQQVK